MVKRLANIVEVEDAERTFEAKDYNYVAERTKLLGLHLISSDFKITPEFYSDRDNVRLAIETEIVGNSLDNETGILVTMFEFTMRGKVKNRVAVKCGGQFVTAYRTPADAESAAAEAFCAKVGLFAAFPYFRAHVAQMAASANADLPPLPMLSSIPHKAKGDVPQLADKKKKASPKKRGAAAKKKASSGDLQ